MSHLVKIKSGQKVVYSNRWVRTSRWAQEQAAGRPLFIKLGDMKGLRGLGLLLLESIRSKMLDNTKGFSTANTSLTFAAGRLLSLNEGDLPYALRILCSGMIEDMGRLTFPGYKGKAFTAHPKLHPKTKELAFFGYDFESKPYMRAGLMNHEGAMTKSWDIDLPWPTMSHDMGATDNYLILLHLPLILDPKEMTKGPNLPLRFDKTLPARIGLLRRDSPSGQAQVQWFELPAFYLFHVAGAFESEGKVHLFGCSMKDFDFKFIEEETPLPPSMLPCLHEYVMDPATGQIEEPRLVSSALGDFPVIHSSRTCLSFRWTYMALFGSRNAMMHGIVKVDCKDRSGSDGSVGTIVFGEGCWGGEAVFVPRSLTSVQPDDEDDGYLVVFVFHEGTGESKLHVYDAKSMSNVPITVIKMPQRVPYGFHGTWISAEDLAEQSK